MASHDTPLVWIDLEMTGLDPDRCHIIEIATVVTTAQLGWVADGPDLVIHASESELETLSDWSREHFTASGLLDKVRASPTSLREAEARTLAFLRGHVKPKVAPLCGNSVHTDRAFLRRHMPALHDFVHYRNVDVSTFKELLKRWYPKTYKAPRKAERHEARADVLESIEELAYYRRTFLVPPDESPGPAGMESARTGLGPTGLGPTAFGHIEVPTTDTAKGVAFYRDVLGFRVVAEQGPYVWVERDGTLLLLRPDPDGIGHGLVLYTADPAAAARKIEATGTEVSLRAKSYHVQDPDGHDIQIVNPDDDHA